MMGAYALLCGACHPSVVVGETVNLLVDRLTFDLIGRLGFY